MQRVSKLLRNAIFLLYLLLSLFFKDFVRCENVIRIVEFGLFNMDFSFVPIFPGKWNFQIPNLQSYNWISSPLVNFELTNVHSKFWLRKYFHYDISPAMNFQFFKLPISKFPLYFSLSKLLELLYIYKLLLFTLYLISKFEFWFVEK